MKKILYVSRLCSTKVMEYIFNTSIVKPQQQAQKFHRLLIEGFAMQTKSCTVETLSAAPITPTNHSRRIWCLPSETGENIRYHYVPTINIPVIKNILVFLLAFIKTVFWALWGGRKDKIVICDILNLAVAAAAFIACKLTGIKVVAIVTDFPNMMHSDVPQNVIQHKIYNMLISTLMFNYNGYILLTEQMNEVINRQHVPYLVMEGLVDVKMKAVPNLLENKPAEKIIIYAGGIYEVYGVKKLIEAFMRLQDDTLRLHIYGPGAMAKDMPGYMTADKRIVYYGIVENDIVVQKQLLSTLLVNPRSSKEEFTKYSFPSKNMEYMVSGTPLLTTPLPGMPKEYYSYVYIFEDETVEGFYKTLHQILSKSREELHEEGRKAKEFVLTCKNNKMQSDRVLSLFDIILSQGGRKD